MTLLRLTRITTIAALGAAAPLSPATAQMIGIEQATLAERAARTAEVSTGEMRDIVRNRSAIVLDTRSRAEFDAGHIPGAVVLDAPADQQIAAVTKLTASDKTKPLVLYCNGPYCQASRRLADRLTDAGFTSVRRYQLGIPVWRALGGPTVIGLDGIKRIFKVDRTAVFFDARPQTEFARGTLEGARSAPADDVVSGRLKKMDLPEDDFNRRIVLFGGSGTEALKLATFMAKRPWHNVSYFPGTYDELTAALAAVR